MRSGRRLLARCVDCDAGNRHMRSTCRSGQHIGWNRRFARQESTSWLRTSVVPTNRATATRPARHSNESPTAGRACQWRGDARGSEWGGVELRRAKLPGSTRPNSCGTDSSGVALLGVTRRLQRRESTQSDDVSIRPTSRSDLSNFDAAIDRLAEARHGNHPKRLPERTL